MKPIAARGYARPEVPVSIERVAAHAGDAKVRLAEADEDARLYEPGHVPGARDLPAVDPEAETIAYCRIGERSSHTWFVLTYLLGFGRVGNPDRSWTERGDGVRLPIQE